MFHPADSHRAVMLQVFCHHPEAQAPQPPSLARSLALRCPWGALPGTSIHTQTHTRYTPIQTHTSEDLPGREASHLTALQLQPCLIPSRVRFSRRSSRPRVAVGMPSSI